MTSERITSHSRRVHRQHYRFLCVISGSLCCSEKESSRSDTSNVLPQAAANKTAKVGRRFSSGRCGQCFDVDFQPEHLQPAKVVVALLLDMVAIKIITAEFGVSLIAL